MKWVQDTKTGQGTRGDGIGPAETLHAYKAMQVLAAVYEHSRCPFFIPALLALTSLIGTLATAALILFYHKLDIMALMYAQITTPKVMAILLSC